MKIPAFIICLFCCFPLIACNSHNEHRVKKVHSSPRDAANYGRVSDIEILTLESKSSGGGAVLGAVIGGVLGHQVGKGSGKDVATGAGAIGGAVAGNNIEKRNGHDSDIYRVTVTFENGSRQKFDYEDIDDLRVGDEVRVRDGQLEQL